MGYHRRSVAETVMFRIKTLLGGHLVLREYDAQVGEVMAMVSTKPDDVVRYAAQRQGRITSVPAGTILFTASDLFNKAGEIVSLSNNNLPYSLIIIFMRVII